VDIDIVMTETHVFVFVTKVRMQVHSTSFMDKWPSPKDPNKNYFANAYVFQGPMDGYKHQPWRDFTG
jgi:hypothetical protein